MTDNMLRYVESLRKQGTLAEAIPYLQSLAETMPESGQLSLEVDPAVSAAEDRLQNSAKYADVSSNEDANRWGDFIIIAKFHGLAVAVDWLMRHCSVLLVPSNTEEVGWIYVGHR